MGAQIHFLPNGPQLTGLKGKTEPCRNSKLQTGAVFSMKVRDKWSCCDAWHKSHLGRTSTPWPSMQKVKLIALTKTLELGDRKKINIHVDSRYASATAHIHRAICQEEELFTSEETNRKSWTSWMP